MLSQHIPLFVGRSLWKEVDIGGHVSDLPPVVVIPGGVGTHAHTALHMTFNSNTGIYRYRNRYLLTCGYHSGC